MTAVKIYIVVFGAITRCSPAGKCTVSTEYADPIFTPKVNGRGNPLRWPRITPSTRKSRHYFADSGGRSVGIVRLRTKATEFS
jgi:hypothetical protein